MSSLHTTSRSLARRGLVCSCQRPHSSRRNALLASPQASTSRALATRAPRVPAAPTRPTPRPSKIETIPFVLGKDQAEHTLETAAATAFGVGSVTRLLVGRFLRKFGIEFERPVRRIAVRPLLLPTWRVDLRMGARGVLGEAGMQFQVTAINASLPGFKLSPLDQLSVTSPWDIEEPVKFDPATHLRQQDQDISVIPFSHSPLNLLANLAGLPRINQQKYGISFDPTSLKTTLMAAYPLYLPIYLGEYIKDAPDGEGEGQRVTCVAFASTTRTAFSIYTAFREQPEWLPNSEGLEVSIGGFPSDSDVPPQPSALQNLAPQLNQLVADGKALSIRDPVSAEEMEQNPRVMAYSEFAFENREHIKAHETLVALEAMMGRIEKIPEGVKAVSLSYRGIKIGDGPSLKSELKKKLYKATKAFEVSRPKWLDDLDKTTQTVAAARKSANGRPK